MNTNARGRHKRLTQSLLCLILCLVMVFGLAACGGEGAVGPQGIQGEQGIPGDQGLPGKDGKDATVLPGITVEEIGASSYVGTPTNTMLVDTNKGKFYPATASKAEADKLADNINRQINAEGQVLLHNNGALPLDSRDRNITLMGVASQEIVVSGGGSGSASQNAQSTAYNWNNAFAEEGFLVNPTLVNKYAAYKNNTTGGVGLKLEMPVSAIGDTEIATYRGYSDAAVLVFYRYCFENFDFVTYNANGHSDPNDTALDLQDNEKDLIKHAKKYFDKVIVIINNSSSMDVSELADPRHELYVDSILWVGGVGQVGCLEAVKIIDGKTNPSGRLPDTWWADLKKDPSFTNVSVQNQNAEGSGRSDAFFRDPQGNQTKFALVEYREDIYMGHRYYETIYDDLVAAGKQAEADAFYAETVAFPFGYGTSYTTFKWQLAGVNKSKTITSNAQYITIKVAVTNTGNMAGKDVVQLYSNPPYTKGGIEKASANLVDFAKTKELKPGETDIVTMKITAQDLASYDWNDKNDNGFSGYELEKGTYVLSARRNSHDVVLSTEFTVANDIKCAKDLQTGADVKNVFTDDDWMNFETVRGDLLANMASRENGVKQPEPVSLADRTLTNAEFELLNSEITYYPYQDNAAQPWFVKANGIPANWTQAATDASTDLNTNAGKDLAARRAKLSGVRYTEPKLVNGTLSFAHLTAEQQANNALWDEYMNMLSYDQIVTYYTGAKGPLSSGLTGSDGPVTFGGGADWPTCPIAAATWNVELIEQQGEMLGTQAMYNGTSGWRGGGINTHRGPFNGRTFEYYSEDGVLAAKIAVAVDTGVTSKGIMCYWKHYFGNDQEYRRANMGGISMFATEQAMREIYLRPFEAVIKNGTGGLMTSFNRLGFIVNSNNWASHQKLLRDEWGFVGGTVNDMWAKSYVSQDLMVRAGDTYLMGSWNSYPTNGLTWGKWDATKRDNKGLPLVPNAEATLQNVKDGTVPSETQYYVLRLAAYRSAFNEVNSMQMKNNVSSMEFTATCFAGVNNSKSFITSADTTNFSITDISTFMGGLTTDDFPQDTYTSGTGYVETTSGNNKLRTYTLTGFTVVETVNSAGNISSIVWTYPQYKVTETISTAAATLKQITARVCLITGTVKGLTNASITQALTGGEVTTATYMKNGISIPIAATGISNVISIASTVAMGTYDIPVTVTADNYVKGAAATIKLKVVSPLTINGTELTGQNIEVSSGANNIDFLVASNIYQYMNLKSTYGVLCISAYNDGSGWKQRQEDETAADIVTYNYEAIKDLSTFSAREPKYEIVGSLPAGLTSTAIMTNPIGYNGLTYTSKINTGMKITGSITTPGTYTFTVKLTTYTINFNGAGAAGWIMATQGTEVIVTQVVTIVVV